MNDVDAAFAAGFSDKARTAPEQRSLKPLNAPTMAAAAAQAPASAGVKPQMAPPTSPPPTSPPPTDGGVPASVAPPKYNPAVIEAAQKALTLTPEERGLYTHYMENGMAPAAAGAAQRPATPAPPFNLQVGDKFHALPTMWGGQALSWDDPQQRAKLLGNIQNAGGFAKYPSYPSAEAANARYAALRNYMARGGR